MTAEDIIARFNLEPLAIEGGWFREYYRAAESIPASGLPGRYGATRAFSTAIYYLLTPGTVSRMHRLKSDELFHFYLGDPVRMLKLSEGGASEIVTLGSDIVSGQQLQTVVLRGVWQGAMLDGDGKWALMGVTVAPGFDYADYEDGVRSDLIAGWPEHGAMIKCLT